MNLNTLLVHLIAPLFVTNNPIEKLKKIRNRNLVK
jgi:hypothetical protein